MRPMIIISESKDEKYEKYEKYEEDEEDEDVDPPSVVLLEDTSSIPP